ncbi:sporulation protein YabP [Salsuginibacillus halophilus]|uniref:Sporulation protein YabP n=1 Tax=Salsuginibacillus halophilus TaxID=517424 RepID=A0A2P8H7R2_9BACI|nr:sporulation protein YabP [Salsuginibacillus halophilus]PSL42262.1 sporulation protein YabP [Salsuginibacillus halophilus]
MERVDDVQRAHDVILKGRRSLDVTGVEEVEHFDSQEFLLQTVMGYLSVRGHDLYMKNVNVEDGLVSIEGKVEDLVYLDAPAGNKKPWFKSLFK